MENCYYSLIRHSQDGLMIGWIPDLPGITATGAVEEDIMHSLWDDARVLLDKMINKGLPPPKPTPVEDLPLGDHRGRYRRLLLVFS